MIAIFQFPLELVNRIYSRVHRPAQGSFSFRQADKNVVKLNIADDHEIDVAPRSFLLAGY